MNDSSSCTINGTTSTIPITTNSIYINNNNNSNSTNNHTTNMRDSINSFNSFLSNSNINSGLNPSNAPNSSISSSPSDRSNNRANRKFRHISNIFANNNTNNTSTNTNSSTNANQNKVWPLFFMSYSRIIWANPKISFIFCAGTHKIRRISQQLLERVAEIARRLQFEGVRPAIVGNRSRMAQIRGWTIRQSK